MTNKKFFTSDLHFSHTNIIKYCNRPFQDADEMDEVLISNWNASVDYEDEVYILGDIFFCPEKKAISILSRLNGKKFFLSGNHDKMIRRANALLNKFDRILPDLHEENIDGITVVMCHYPLLTWRAAHRGTFMLHGHSHGKIPFDNQVRRLDIGVDCHNYRPIEWTEIKRKLIQISPSSHSKDL